MYSHNHLYFCRRINLWGY